MGYFSNGTEGMDYEEQYCSRCVHCNGCPIWGLHFEHNYTKSVELRGVLDYLIPRRKDSLGNEKCRMFHAAPEMNEPARVPLKGTVARLKNRVIANAMEEA